MESIGSGDRIRNGEAAVDNAPGAHGGVFDIPGNPNAITVIDVQGPDALIEICSKAANWAHLLSRTSSTVAR